MPISHDYLAQNRFAGKFTLVRRPLPLRHLLPKSASIGVYGVSPGFLGYFHEVAAPMLSNFLAQMRLAGEFAFVLRRCLRAICLSKSPDLGVYGISPRFLHDLGLKYGGFHIR